MKQRLIFCLIASIGNAVAGDLKISDCQMESGAENSKILKVEIASAIGDAINMTNVQVRVYILEKNQDGKVGVTGERVASKWTSFPINWFGGAKERLEITYPGASSGTGSSYYGYAVGIYYNDSLQDVLYEPDNLDKTFRLPSSVR